MRRNSSALCRAVTRSSITGSMKDRSGFSTEGGLRAGEGEGMPPGICPGVCGTGWT